MHHRNRARQALAALACLPLIALTAPAAHAVDGQWRYIAEPSMTISSSAQASALAVNTPSLICMPANCAPYLSQMHATNPYIQIAAYAAVDSASASAEVPGCLAHDSAGHELENLQWKTYLEVPNCAAWLNHLTTSCQANLSAGFDRCYLDIMGGGDWDHIFVDTVTHKPAAPAGFTQPSWDAAKATAAQAVRAAGNRLIWINCYFTGRDYLSRPYCRNPAVEAADVAEGFLGMGPSAPHAFGADSTMLRESTIPVLAMCKMTAYSIAQAGRCLTTWALEGDGQQLALVVPNAAISTFSAANIAAQLGQPRGPEPVVTSAVMARAFTCGYAVLNASTTGHTFALASGSYTDLSGARVSGGTQSLRPWQGDIYIRSGCIAPHVPLPLAGSGLTPVTPTVIAQSRIALGLAGPLAAGSTSTVPISPSLVPAGATAVALTVTPEDATSASYLSIGGAPSDVNYAPGSSYPHLVIAPLMGGNAVSVFNAGPGNVNAELTVTGYFSASGSLVTPIAPLRVLDTRHGIGSTSHPVAAGSSISFAALGSRTVPAGTTAVLANVTAVDGTAAGTVGTTPGDTGLTFPINQPIADQMILPVDSAGHATLSVGGCTCSVDLIVDVQAVFSSTGQVFHATPAMRVADSRIALGLKTTLSPHSSQTMRVAYPAAPVSAFASAALLNVTVTGASGSGWLSVGPSASTTTSSINWLANQTLSNQVLSAVTAQGTVTVYNGSAVNVSVVIDAKGYVSAS